MAGERCNDCKKKESSVSFTICDLWLCEICLNKRLEAETAKRQTLNNQNTAVGLEVSDNETKAHSSSGSPRSSLVNTNNSQDFMSQEVNASKSIGESQRAEPVVNEVLCFMVNKMDSLPCDILIKLMSDTYNEAEIDAAKTLAFDMCAGEDGPRLIRRRGQNKKCSDLQDILSLLQNVEIHMMPVFVARDLSNLPPLSAGHFDMAKLGKDFERVKHELSLLKDVYTRQQREIMDQLKELVKPHDAPQKDGPDGMGTGSLEESHVDNEQTLVKQSYDGSGPTHDFFPTQGATVITDTESENDSIDDCTDEHVFHSGETALRSESNGRDGFQTVRGRRRAAHRQSQRGRGQRQDSSARRRHGGSHSTHWNSPGRPSSGANYASRLVSTSKSRQTGNQRQDRSQHFGGPKQKASIVTGTGRFQSLRAAPAPQKDTSPAGVFVSRLHEKTTRDMLQEHLLQTTNLRVKCIPLPSRRDKCASFRILVPDVHAARLLNCDIWPSRVIVRRFKL